MKKLLPKLLVFAILLTAFPGLSQRYITEQFTDVTVTQDVKYGENYTVLTGSPTLQDLVMDVYEPTGDTQDDRYLIVLMHAGSFLPKGANTLPFGNNRDSGLVEIATQLAKRGWVVANINYRLGWNPAAPAEEDRASTIINAVYRSMQDLKTAIRFFRKDAATTDTYNIDPLRVVAGGDNSGGYAVLAAGALDKGSEINYLKFLDGQGASFIDTTTAGGFQGEGGVAALNVVNHTGYASNPQLVLNLGGAMADTLWQEAGEAPIVSFHGVADALTPYKTAVVIVASTMQAIIEVSGSHDLARRANSLGNADVWHNANYTDAYTMVAESRTPYEGLFPFPGPANGFEPWAWYSCDDLGAVGPITTDSLDGCGSAANPAAYKAKALAYIDTIMQYFTPRAVDALANPLALDLPLNAEDLKQAKNHLTVAPNPATDLFRIESSYHKPITQVRMTDITGRTVLSETNLNTNRHNIARGDLPAGIYLLNVELGAERVTQKLIFR